MSGNAKSSFGIHIYYKFHINNLCLCYFILQHTITTHNNIAYKQTNEQTNKRTNDREQQWIQKHLMGFDKSKWI